MDIKVMLILFLWWIVLPIGFFIFGLIILNKYYGFFEKPKKKVVKTLPFAEPEYKDEKNEGKL